MLDLHTRVLILLPAVVGDGASVFNLELVPELAAFGIAASIFTLKRQPDDVDLPHHLDVDGAVIAGIPRERRLRYGYPALPARLLRAARDSDVIVSGYEVGTPVVAAYAAGRAARRPVVCEMQADPIGALESLERYGWSPAWTARATRSVYPRLDAVVCVSPWLRQRAADMGVPEKVTHVIPNGVQPDRVKDLAKGAPPDWLPSEDYVVGIGRLASQKGFDLLIEAHARTRAERPHSLVLLGEGPDREELEQLAASRGVGDSVLMPGYVENPFPVLAGASLFCMPSRFEGCPLSLAEALALGVPSIAADCVSGPSDLLARGRYGELVAVESVDELAAAMAHHFQDPGALRERAQAAFSNGNGYTVEGSAAAYAELFTQLAHGARAPT